MKVKAYVRIARDPDRPLYPKIEATVKPSSRPLTRSDGRTELPTIAFALELIVPDALFRQAEQVIATVTIPEAAATVAADVRILEAPAS
jgi:hypothetical protein